MSNEIYEILKEYFIAVPGMKERVRARVCKLTLDDDDVRYTYSFSHYFYPSAESQFPLDETIVRRDFEQANIIVLQYLENFTAEFQEPIKNNFY